MGVPHQSTIQLNEAQRAVLVWIKDGCPEGVYPAGDYTHRSSARALHNRGLVRVSGHGPTWKAALTDRGKAWPGVTEEDQAAFEQKQEAQSRTTRLKKTAAKTKRQAVQDKAGEANPAEGVQQSQSAVTGRYPRPQRERASPPPRPEFEVISPAQARRNGKKPRGDALTGGAVDPWDEKIMITVKEAAWMLSISEHTIREAVRNGDVQRVFIGGGESRYRIVYGSLLAWVDEMPREPRSYRSWWR